MLRRVYLLSLASAGLPPRCLVPRAAVVRRRAAPEKTMARYDAKALILETGASTDLGPKVAGKLWEAVVGVLESTFSAGRGLNIPNLGRWTFLNNSTREKGAATGLDSGDLASHSFKSRVFVADDRFLRAHGLVNMAPPARALLAPATILNLASVACGAGLDKDAARQALVALVRHLGAAAATGKGVHLRVGSLGTLVVESRVVRFQFRESAPKPHWFERPDEPARGTRATILDHFPLATPDDFRTPATTARTSRVPTSRSLPPSARGSQPPTARVSSRPFTGAAEPGDPPDAVDWILTAHGAPRSDRPHFSEPASARDALMAPMGRSMVRSRSLPKKTARSTNLRARYDAYDAQLARAKEMNRADDERIAAIRDDERNREAARRAANYAARLENAKALQAQGDHDRAKRAVDRELRRSLKHDNPSRAFPIGAPLDLAEIPRTSCVSSLSPPKALAGRRARRRRAGFLAWPRRPADSGTRRGRGRWPGSCPSWARATSGGGRSR